MGWVQSRALDPFGNRDRSGLSWEVSGVGAAFGFKLRGVESSNSHESGYCRLWEPIH
jgi:hypothetical protein